MCGICGKVHTRPDQPVDSALLHRMCDAISHRGPNAEGFYLQGACGLGHRRLSIIDLSTGQQPIYNEDNSLCIVFNGEIYNFRALRDQLVARGHIFRTKSDTETILHLYEEKGERCVEDLRGMFAFAIWNEARRELFIARDRLGKKPLHYILTPDGIAFASEMKALLVDPSVSREIDPAGLDDYLTFHYVPAPRTIFKSIQKLPPAHTLFWRDGQAQIRRYWTLNYEPKIAANEADICAHLRDLIDESVRIRLESDVPLGCLLSGGIDSAAVTAFMRRHVTGSLRTFSIGFDEESHNELPYARQIAQRFETEHEEFVMKPNAIDVLGRLVWHCDEPMSDSSALATYYVSEITRRHVTVALNGDGGDESFAGYTRYRGMAAVNRYGRIPQFLRQGAASVLNPLSRALPNFVPLEKAQYLNQFSLYDDARHYAQYLVILREYMKPLLYSDSMRNALGRRDALDYVQREYRRADLTCDIDRKLNTDVNTYLPGDLLVKMDRMTMAHGLEGRSPFLDHVLMEYAASLPGEIKYANGTLKNILKKALEPVLPRETLYRAKKGFSLPINKWFREDLKDFTRDILLSDQAKARGYFNPTYVEKLINDHVAQRQPHHHRLWSLLCFEIWCRTFLDRTDLSSGAIAL